MKSVQKQTKTLGNWAKQNSRQFKMMGAAIAAMGAVAIVTFTKMIKKYVEVGDMIDKMSKRTGFAAETLSELAYAAEISGADIAMLEKGVKSMAKTIAYSSDGIETYLREFRKIGINVEDLMKLNPEQQFIKIAMAISKVEHASIKSAAAQVIFGRAGMMLLPLFAEGEKGIKALSEEAHKLGIIFDKEAAAKAAKLKDAQLALSKAFQGLGFALAEEFIPVLTEVAKKFTDMTVGMQGNVKNLATVILGAFRIIAGGIHGLLLAWHGLRASVYAFSAELAKIVGKQAVQAHMLALVAKKLGLSSSAYKTTEMVLAALIELHKDYKKELDDELEASADIIVSYDAWIAKLNAISVALTTTKDKTKELNEVVKEVNETFKINAEDVLKKAATAAENYWGIADITIKVTEGLTAAQLKQKAAMEAITMAYVAGAAGMIDAIKRVAIAELIKALVADKTIPFFLKLAILIPSVALMNKVFSGLAGGKSYKEGGYVPEETFAHLHAGEYVVPKEEVDRGVVGRSINLTVAPQFNVSAMDAIGVDEFVRNIALPAIVEALRVGIMKPEIQRALGV